MNFTAKSVGLTCLACLAVGLLLGYIPEHLAKSKLETNMSELTQKQGLTEERLRLDEFAVRAAVVSADADSNNYADASRHASELFTGLRQSVDRSPDDASRQTLTQVLSKRDAVIAGLAQADPAVRPELHQIFKSLQSISTVSLK